MEATKQQIEQAERIWTAQQDYSTARAKLEESCLAMSKALEALGQSLGDLHTAARTLGGLAVELPLDCLPEPERAHALAERALALREVDTWIAATDAARERMVPACFAVAEASIILHNAEHGQAPDKQ